MGVSNFRLYQFPSTGGVPRSGGVAHFLFPSIVVALKKKLPRPFGERVRERGKYCKLVRHIGLPLQFLKFPSNGGVARSGGVAHFLFPSIVVALKIISLSPLAEEANGVRGNSESNSSLRALRLKLSHLPILSQTVFQLPNPFISFLILLKVFFQVSYGVNS